MTENRIFCIGRNYTKHIEELGNAPDSACLVFMKPNSCIVRPGQPLQLPRDQGAVHHEAEVVVRLSGGGSNIAASQALDCVDAVTLGLDLTLRELQNTLKAKGAPWELAKAFDGAAPLGDWIEFHGQFDLAALPIELSINGERRQSGNTRDLLYPIPRLIEILSRSWALRPGDVIYTGTPEGVGPVQAGDELRLHSAPLGEFVWHAQ